MSHLSNYQWHRVNPGTLPTSRKGSCMAYNALHAVTVLFGGGGFNDTWHWNGQNWIEQRPHVAPASRMSACMVHDAVHKCTLLFGGTDNHGKPLGDTWIWDGSSWTQHKGSAPTPRSGACMAYDEANQRIILFGGQAYGGRAGTLLNDTWAWDGSSWRRLSVPLAPPARLGANMIYHAQRQYIILFGGTNGNTTFNDTWIWHGATWRRLSPTNSPPARAWASIAYHSPTQHTVLISGQGDSAASSSPVLSDTWTWDGITWTQLPVTHAPAGGYHSASYDKARQSVVLYTATSSKPSLGDKTGPLLSPLSTVATTSSETWLWAPTP